MRERRNKTWVKRIYDCEDENGNTITKYQYFADAEDYEVQEHCELNGYLFTIKGDCVHHLIEEIKNKN